MCVQVVVLLHFPFFVIELNAAKNVEDVAAPSNPLCMEKNVKGAFTMCL